jgi:hypothetical protein
MLATSQVTTQSGSLAQRGGVGSMGHHLAWQDGLVGDV